MSNKIMRKISHIFSVNRCCTADIINFKINSGEQIVHPEDLIVLMESSEHLCYDENIFKDFRNVVYDQKQKVIYYLIGIGNLSYTDFEQFFLQLLMDIPMLFWTVKGLERTDEKDDFSSKPQNAYWLPRLIPIVINFTDQPWNGPHCISDLYMDDNHKLDSISLKLPLNVIDPYSLDESEFEQFNMPLKQVFQSIALTSAPKEEINE